MIPFTLSPRDASILLLVLAGGIALPGCPGKSDAPETSSATDDPGTGRTTGESSTDAPATSAAGTTGDTTAASTSSDPSSTTSSTTAGTTAGDASSSTTGAADPLVGCEPVWPQTGPVQGATPIGELAFHHAAFDPDGCDTIDSITLFLSPEMPVFTDIGLVPAPVLLRVELTGDAWAQSWVGEGAVQVILLDADAQSLGQAPGVLTVESLDLTDTSYLSDNQSHWLTGSLAVDAPGWSLHGSFTAAICWMIEGFTLCP